MRALCGIRTSLCYLLTRLLSGSLSLHGLHSFGLVGHSDLVLARFSVLLGSTVPGYLIPQMSNGNSYNLRAIPLLALTAKLTAKRINTHTQSWIAIDFGKEETQKNSTFMDISGR